MNYPNPQQPGYGQPQYQPAPPAQPGGYGPPAPVYNPAAPPGYGQPPAPAYGAPQGYGQAPPPPPPAQTFTDDDFLGQPTGGSGKSISGYLGKQPVGTRLIGKVARKINPATDVKLQTVPGTNFPVPPYKDGRQKKNLTIPLVLQEPYPHDQFEDGRASWIITITDYRDEVLPAMVTAGVQIPDENGKTPFPEEGATMVITYQGERTFPGMTGAPKKVKSCEYYRPQGVNGQPAPQQAPAPQPQYAAPNTNPGVPDYGQAPGAYAQPQGQPQLPTTPGAPPYQGQPPAPMAPAQYQPPATPQYQSPVSQPQYTAPMPPQQAQAPAPAPQATAPQNTAGYTGPAPLPADKNALFGQLQQGQQQAPPAAAPPAPPA